MRRSRARLPLLLVLLLVLPGCLGSKNTPATPGAAAAMKADEVVIRVNELQAVLSDACGPQPECQPGSLPTATFREALKAFTTIRTTLRSVPDGWRATVQSAWRDAKGRLQGLTNPAILAALGLVDALIGGL